MVSDIELRTDVKTSDLVLILILLEDGFWLYNFKFFKQLKVLILILLEDGFWFGKEMWVWDDDPTVLILILLEDGFWFELKKAAAVDIVVLILILLEDGFWSNF